MGFCLIILFAAPFAAHADTTQYVDHATVYGWVQREIAAPSVAVDKPDDYDTADGTPPLNTKSKACSQHRGLGPTAAEQLKLTEQIENLRCAGVSTPSAAPTASDMYSTIMGQTALEIDDVLRAVARERIKKKIPNPDPRFKRNCMAGVKYAMCGDPSGATNIDRNRSHACDLDISGKWGWPEGASALQAMKILKKRTNAWTDVSCGGCTSPAAAPFNSVICYEPIVSQKEFEKAFPGKKDPTAKYGHCEIKVQAPDGRTKYCYDGCANHPRTGNPALASNVIKNRRVAAIFVRNEAGIKPSCGGSAK